MERRVPERSLTGVLSPGCPRPIDRLQQGSAAERLMEESDRPRLQRACANFGFRVCRDEDDWNRQVACGETPLKLQPVHSRQTDVEDQARGVVSRWRSKKSFRGRENLGGQIGRIHQARQGVSNRWIVIDDGDRKVLRHTAKRQSRRQEYAMAWPNSTRPKDRRLRRLDGYLTRPPARLECAGSAKLPSARGARDPSSGGRHGAS